MAPIAVALSAIRDAADRGAPRAFAGKAENPISQILQNADIGWTASRGPIAATGAQDVLTLATPLTGTLNVTGSLSAKATGAVGDALGGLLGGNVAKQIGSVNIKNLNASAEIKGNVVITARPKIAANWRIEPNLTAQVNLSDSSLSVAGARINVPAQVKPLIDKKVAEQITLVQARMRNDPAFEKNAKVQWAKACRSIPLQGTDGRLDDAGAVAGVAADTGDCRATAHRRVEPHADARHRGGDPHHAGRDQAVLPVPRHHRHRAADAGTGRDRRPHRHALHRHQQDRGSAVRRKDLSGGRFGFSRRHRQARHRRGVGKSPADFAVGERQGKEEFLGLRRRGQCAYLGTSRCSIRHEQTLRLTDIELAVESEAAFGLLGAAARAAIPHLQKALADKATVDLKPFASNAQKKIAAVIADFQKNEDGMRVSAEISKLRLADIAFDSKTLRVIAEAEGAINVYVTALPAL